jgi:HEAT repeat protein
VLALIKKLLEDSNWSIRSSAINCLSSLGAQGTYSLEALFPAEAAAQWSFSRRSSQQFLES